jgi:hypothetical protein
MLLEQEKALVELRSKISKIRGYEEREGWREGTYKSFGLGVPSGDVSLFQLFFLFFEGQHRN